MRFGMLYELQLPKPWAEDSEQRLVDDARPLVTHGDLDPSRIVGPLLRRHVDHAAVQSGVHRAPPFRRTVRRQCRRLSDRG